MLSAIISRLRPLFSTQSLFVLFALCCITLIFPQPAEAGVALYEDGDRKVELSADFRVRLENDWDSQSGDGTERDDRLRLRSRARITLDAQLNKAWSAVFRLRSGSDDSQQSPHITLYDFDDNDTGDADFNLDLWYTQYQDDRIEAWAGRNHPNFWHQDEFVLDGDINAPGVGFTYKQPLGSGSLSYKAGLGSLPAGMRAFSGQYASGQLVYDRDTEARGVTLAAGVIDIDADPDDPDGLLLLTENNTRDYQTGTVQAQLRMKQFSQPLKLAVTAGRNFEDYDDAPAGSFSEFHKDDKDFFIAFVNWGNNKQTGDWLFGYYYAYIEALALSSSYSEDDWLRWGNATQTRATNVKGHEFKAAYTISSSMNVVARLFLADAIDLLNQGDIAKEDGKRARVDFNIKF